MCGINGIFLREKTVDADTLSRMNDAIMHRGPDGYGSYISKNKKNALGHTRLSIIDLSATGKQPMFNEDKTISVVFNGEIYNFQDLVKELEGKHKFKSKSDTEVLLHLYEEEGENMLKKLRGMFAFIIYDEKNNRALIARDRMGEKPILYSETNDGVIVSSEITALLKTGKVDKEVNLEALGYYFLHNFKHIPEPFTVYKGISKLKPASFMIIENGRIKKIEKYWKPSFEKMNVDDEKITVENFRSLLEDAIRSREIADVEISALLSGGVDSSAVTAYVSKDKNELRTFSMGENEQDEELKRARKIAEMFKTKHKEFIFQPEQLDIFEKLIEYYGEPIYLTTLIYAYVLFEAIKKENIKVTLTGNGLDELLFGYDGSNKLMLLSHIFKITDRLPKILFKFLAKIIPDDIGIFFSMASVENRKKKGEIYRKKSRMLKELFSTTAYDKIKDLDFGRLVDEVCEDCNSEEYIEHAYYAGLMLENAHSVTIAGDLPAMIHSIETRAPFLDHKLAEFIFKLPTKFKVKSIMDKSKNKYIAKKALEGILPKETLYAKKMGFGYNVKISELIRTEWKERFREKVLDGNYHELGIFNKVYIQKMFEDHLKGLDNSRVLLALYAIEIWYEKFIKE